MIQSMFNFPNWLCEEIYFIVFVLQTPFVLNFNKTRSTAVLLLALSRRRILQREKNEQQDRKKKGGQRRVWVGRLVSQESEMRRNASTLL